MEGAQAPVFLTADKTCPSTDPKTLGSIFQPSKRRHPSTRPVPWALRVRPQMVARDCVRPDRARPAQAPRTTTTAPPSMAPAPSAPMANAWPGRATLPRSAPVARSVIQHTPAATVLPTCNARTILPTARAPFALARGSARQEEALRFGPPYVQQLQHRCSVPCRHGLWQQEYLRLIPVRGRDLRGNRRLQVSRPALSNRHQDLHRVHQRCAMPKRRRLRGRKHLRVWSVRDGHLHQL